MDPVSFKGMKLVVATPMYRPEVSAAYKHSYSELLRFLTAAGISYAQHEVHDTYLPRGRNILAMAMLETDATHHVLLDADMGWNSEDFMRMLYHAATRPEIEVIGAAYPQKHIDWQRVKDAVLQNHDITPYQLSCVAPGKWTFTGLANGTHDLGMPVELTLPKAHVGTGLMVVRRSAYERAKSIAPVYTDRQSGKACYQFFHADVNRQSMEWIGEDVWFCRKWQQMGGKIWLAPWVKSEHVGTFSFIGDVSAVVDAGVDLTA